MNHEDRHAHITLMDGAAEAEAWRRASIAILAAKSTSYPACVGGPCNGGRACPSPQACQRARKNEVVAFGVPWPASVRYALFGCLLLAVLSVARDLWR